MKYTTATPTCVVYGLSIGHWPPACGRCEPSEEGRGEENGGRRNRGMYGLIGTNDTGILIAGNSFHSLIRILSHCFDVAKSIHSPRYYNRLVTDITSNLKFSFDACNQCSGKLIPVSSSLLARHKSSHFPQTITLDESSLAKTYHQYLILLRQTQ